MRFVDFCGNKISQMGIGTTSFITKGFITESIIYALQSQETNYIDTAYSYYDGNGEIAVSNAILYFPRNIYYIATKCSLVEGGYKKATLPTQIDKQIYRLGCGYIDYFMVHGLGFDISSKIQEIKNNYPEFQSSLDYIKSEGYARNIGFSYAGSADDLLDFLNIYDWDFVMIKNNLIDNFYKKSIGEMTLIEAALKYKSKHPNFGIMSMEIFEHGLLSTPKNVLPGNISPRHVILNDFYNTGLPFIVGARKHTQLRENFEMFRQISQKSCLDQRTISSLEKILVDHINNNLQFNCNRCLKCSSINKLKDIHEYVLEYNKYKLGGKIGPIKTLINDIDLEKIELTEDDLKKCDQFNLQDFLDELKIFKNQYNQ